MKAWSLRPLSPASRSSATRATTARFEYIYKFVSASQLRPGDRRRARFSTKARSTSRGSTTTAPANGWRSRPGENGLTPENGFADLADILVNTRAAADQAGATKMDRPEWGTIDPATGEVYFTLTNNNRRDMTQVDAANPRAENNFGQIVRWTEAGADHALATFRLGPLRDRRRRRRSSLTAGRRDARRRQHLRLPGRHLVRPERAGSGSRPTWANRPEQNRTAGTLRRRTRCWRQTPPPARSGAS